MPTRYDLTDMDGDRVRFTHTRDGHAFVTVQSASGTFCAGPFTRAQLVEALDAVAPAERSTGPGETTGGALARLQAEMTRLLDEADAEPRDEARGAPRARLGARAESRPPAPDAITDEMVGRGRTAYPSGSDRLIRAILTAALTEPPRPEDTAADRLRALLAAYDGQDPDADDYEGRLSVYLARHGVRVEEDR